MFIADPTIRLSAANAHRDLLANDYGAITAPSRREARIAVLGLRLAWGPSPRRRPAV